MSRLVVAALAVSLAGCGLSEEKFLTKYAKLYCRNLEECGKLETQYGTHDECIKAQEIVADEELIPDGCSIIPDVARDCLKELRKSKGECGINANPAPTCEKVAGCTCGVRDTGE